MRDARLLAISIAVRLQKKWAIQESVDKTQRLKDCLTGL